VGEGGNAIDMGELRHAIFMEMGRAVDQVERIILKNNLFFGQGVRRARGRIRPQINHGVWFNLNSACLCACGSRKAKERNKHTEESRNQSCEPKWVPYYIHPVSHPSILSRLIR
jgi:hypothetical protein